MNYEYIYGGEMTDLADMLKKIVKGMEEASQEIDNEPQPKPRFSRKYREAYQAALEIEQLEELHAEIVSTKVKLSAQLDEIEDRIVALKSKLN